MRYCVLAGTEVDDSDLGKPRHSHQNWLNVLKLCGFVPNSLDVQDINKRQENEGRAVVRRCDCRNFLNGRSHWVEETEDWALRAGLMGNLI